MFVSGAIKRAIETENGKVIVMSYKQILFSDS
jgi:hypothetical protein